MTNWDELQARHEKAILRCAYVVPSQRNEAFDALDAVRAEIKEMSRLAAIGAKVEAMPPLTTLGRSEAGDWFCRKPLDLSVGTMWADTPLAALAALEAAQEPKE